MRNRMINRLRSSGRRFRGQVATVASPTVLLSDAFTDADTTPLASHTMDVGGGWTEDAGTWTVTSNTARDAGAGSGYATADAGQLDIDVQVTFTTAAINNSGIVSRFANTPNFALFSITGTLFIFIANVPTDRGSSAFTIGDGDILGMRWDGDTVVCHRNGVDLFSYTLDGTEIAAIGTATRVGLRANADGTARFDDFLCVAN